MELDGINDLISSLSPEETESLKNTAQSLVSAQSGDFDMGLFMKAKEMMDKANAKSSNEVQLITALEPFLDEPKKQRAAEAKRLLRLVSVLPLLKELFYDSQ